MTKQLVVQSDDFGMSNAGNEGVVKAFEEGILTHEQLAEALERQRFYEARGHPRRLGEVLAIMRAISPEELEKALERQKKETKS